MNPIVMPYLNAGALTRQAALDCLGQSLPDLQLLLIDNGSQEPDRYVADDLRQISPHVLGWHHDPPFPALAAVWNRALRFCWEAGAPHAFVVNNDVRLHPDTYAVLLESLQESGAWFVSAVSVTEAQFDPTIDLRAARGQASPSREDGVRPEGWHYGGPDFSCFVISRECHKWFQFDEGFIPAYHEDNDFHRRLKLAGFGEKIFGLNVPFLHYGSGTLKANPRMQESWPARFGKCQQYYIEKWGGLPGSETFQVPFNQGIFGPGDHAYQGGVDPRLYSFYQGKGGGTIGPLIEAREAFPGLFDAAGG